MLIGRDEFFLTNTTSDYQYFIKLKRNYCKGVPFLFCILAEPFIIFLFGETLH